MNSRSSNSNEIIKISLFNGTSASHMTFVDQVTEVNLNSIAQYITSKSWSPGIFKENNVNGVTKIHRSNENFLRADVFGIDIDGGCTIEQAKQILRERNLQSVIGITRNHQKEKVSPSGKSSPACDRFRIILFLESPVCTAAGYKEVFESIKLIFPFCDSSCSDAARFYFPCKKVIFENQGNKFEVKSNGASPSLHITNSGISPNSSKGPLSNRTLNFIANGAPDGSWHRELIPTLFDLKEQGYSQEDAKIQIRKASLSANGDLDAIDLAQIKDVFENRTVKNPKKERKEKLSVDQIAERVKFNLDNIVQMSTVNVKAVEFVWDPYIAKGFVTLFTGDPGAGKSTITAHIISIISKGGIFWDKEQSKQGNVVILTAEDPLEEALKPRLTNAGANTQNVYAFTLPLEFDEIGKQTILEAIKKYNPVLLVIDPLVAYIGAEVDTSRANEVRAKMQFLSDLAKDFRLAVLVIRHCAKGSGKENTPLIYKGHGSIDFVAAVRSEVMLICDPKNVDGRYFGHTKSNLTKLGNTLYFSMTSHGPVLDRIVDKSLSELFNEEMLVKSDARSTIDEVGGLIQEILTQGPAFKNDLKKELKEAGFTIATIRRGLESIKTTVSKRITYSGKPQGTGVWLVCTEQQAQALKDMKFEHLEQLKEWISKWKIQHAQISFTPPPTAIARIDRGNP